jgi:hypothetical protein
MAENGLREAMNKQYLQVQDPVDETGLGEETRRSYIRKRQLAVRPSKWGELISLTRQTRGWCKEERCPNRSDEKKD